jgi:antitoxin ParD1/3/4
MAAARERWEAAKPGFEEEWRQYADERSAPLAHAPARLKLHGREVVAGMITGMTREKIAITLPEEQVAAARQAVAEGRAASVSAYISQALARRSAEEEMAEIIAEIYAQAGEPAEEDRAWARRVLGVEP